MSTQQQPRPWFRLASMMRPSAPPPTRTAPPPTRPAPPPTTALQPAPPVPPFRPPAALPQPSTQPPEPPRPLQPAVTSPPPQATAPPSPVQSPARLNLPIASPRSASRTPVVISPAPMSPVVTSPAPMSPVAPAGVPTTAATPATIPEPPPQAEPSKPESVIISSPSIQATRQVVSSSTFPPSPKTNASAAPSSPPLPTAPAPKTSLSTPAPPAPSPSPARIPAPRIATVTAPPPPSPARNAAPSITTVTAPPAAPGITTVTAPPPPSPVRPAPIIPSPKVVKQWDRKTPPDQSPIQKTLSHPPSPLTLPPPAQLKPDDRDYMEPIPAEAQQKTVLMHVTSMEKHKIMAVNNGGLQNNKHGEVKKDAKGILSKKTSTSSSEEQFGTRIITLAGENKGAVMELSSPSRRKFASAYNNAQKFNGSSGMDDDDRRSKMKEGENAKNGFMKMQAQAAPMDAFVNNNVQGVNNSILYNCAYTNRNPGVHFSVSRNGNAGRGAHLLKDAALDD